MSTKSSTDVQKSVRPAEDAPPSFIEEARRAQIIACAIDAIAEVGYARASMAEIAKRAHVSKSVISYYFASKDELIRQVAATVFQGGAEFMLPMIEAEMKNGAAAVLRAYIDSNIAFMAAKRNHVLAIVNIVAGAGADSLAEEPDADGYSTAINELEQILQFGQQNGEFRAFDAKIMAIAIRAAIDGLPPRLAADPGLDLDACASELATTFDLATRAERRRKK